MKVRILTIALFFAATALNAAGPEPVPVTATSGKVDKVTKDTLVLQARDESGKFAKAVTLHITGTSKIWTLSTRMQDKKVVVVQKDTDSKDLEAGQAVTVIYATPKGQDPVLLTAVVQPGEK